MSAKMECPGCNSETSTLLSAYQRGEPCPYCGLSANAIAEIRLARQRAADRALTEKYEALVKHADALESELRVVRGLLDRVKSVVQDWPFRSAEPAN